MKSWDRAGKSVLYPLTHQVGVRVERVWCVMVERVWCVMVGCVVEMVVKLLE